MNRLIVLSTLLLDSATGDAGDAGDATMLAQKAATHASQRCAQALPGQLPLSPCPFVRPDTQQLVRLSDLTPSSADCKPAGLKPALLRPGSAEHKASRWERYQKRGGEKTYEQWSKQYDVNMRNFSHGIEREKFYREMMSASEGIVKTPFTNRQIDILKNSEKYAG